MNNQEQFQNEVLKDFKDIVNELSQIKTFSGLMMHQQKIQSLYEKYIFLKQLNNLKYQQILETALPQPVAIQKENSISHSTDKVEVPEVEKPLVEEVAKPEGKELESIEEDKEIEELAKEAQEDKPQERKDKLTPIAIEIAEIKPHEKRKVLEPIHLDFNDSIAFISQLFNGSKADMDKEFVVLNETRNIEEAKKWMEKMFHTYNWKDKEEFVERLSGLIINRFEV